MIGAGESGAAPLICFAGGGTGGHIYPALAVADAIRDQMPGARFLFFGTSRKIDDHILGRAGYEAVRQDLQPLTAKPWLWPRLYWRLTAAGRVCRQRFQNDRPSFVIGTGGMACVPAVLRAARLGIATGILNPDALPGRANRFLASKAVAVFAQWGDTAACLPRSNVLVTGCPVRPEFLTAGRDAGIARFGLDPAKLTLLITGASQGARTVNEAVLANADMLAARSDWQVLHLTGKVDYDRVSRDYEGRRLSAKVIAYTDHMAEAIAAADLVISRAGASTLAELTAIGRPSILLPYPYHKDQHQRANAECLVRGGAARLVTDFVDTTKTGPALKDALADLVGDRDLRARMSAAATSIGRREAARTIADFVLTHAVRRVAC